MASRKKVQNKKSVSPREKEKYERMEKRKNERKKRGTNGKIERGRGFENFSSRQSTFTTGEIEFNGDAYAAFRDR